VKKDYHREFTKIATGLTGSRIATSGGLHWRHQWNSIALFAPRSATRLARANGVVNSSALDDAEEPGGIRS
jgi:hypothetical protein